MNNDTLELEIFRAGDYGAKGNYDELALEQIAGDYAAQLHEAPVTIDHAQQGPADGWVAGLRRAGDRLVATLARLSPRLRELIASGAYKKRSIELYRRFRGTDRPYLKAVTFLGAAAPEVKGLADPIFSETTVITTDSLTAEQRTAAATAARDNLIANRRWNPAWEQHGILAVFEQIAGTPALDQLTAILSATEPAVQFGETISDDLTSPISPEASPESVQRHRQALVYLAQHPNVSYAEALLATSR